MLSFQEYGDKRNFPLIFFHGFLGNKYDWEYVIKELCSKFYCIAIDLPGHSMSSIDDQISFDSFAKIFIQFIECRNIRKLVVIGYSMGGRIAHFIHSHYLKELPCICIGSHLGLNNNAAIEKRKAWNRLILSHLTNKSVDEFLKFWYSQELFNSFRKSKMFLKVLEHRSNNNSKALKAALGAFCLTRQKILYPDFQTYFIVGENDHRYLKYYKKIKCAYHILENTAHVAHLENPQGLAIKIKEILNEK